MSEMITVDVSMEPKQLVELLASGKMTPHPSGDGSMVWTPVLPDQARQMASTPVASETAPVEASEGSKGDADEH